MPPLSFYIYVVAPVLMIAFWIKIGSSPFVWLAHLGVHLEAARVQLISSVWLAMRHFAKQYPRQVERVRQEVMG